MKMRFLAVIPARFASTRFPGKPLVQIGSKTMVEMVYRAVSEIIPNTVVATDDQRIFDVVVKNGGQCVMTSDQHESGTERCLEALQKVQKEQGHFDVVLNVQGDEPFIEKEHILLIQRLFGSHETQIATLAKKITNVSELLDENKPKLVFDNQKNAIYFSRNPIPFIRGIDKTEWLNHHDFFKHIGFYAYQTEVLEKIVSLPPSTLELAERLEQLRWLEYGYNIKLAITSKDSLSIDTPEDLEKAKLFFKKLNKLEAK